MSDAMDLPREAREQRAGPRRDAVIRCWVIEDSVERFTRITDLGMGGARVVTASPPPVNTTLMLRFTLRDDGPEVLAHARVVWRSEGFRGRGGLIGVAFSSMNDAGEIMRFLQE